MIDKKENAIVFIVNSDYRFALATTLINLQKTNPNIYDGIVVYHDDLTVDDMVQLKKIEPKIKFIEYAYDTWEKEHKKPTTPLSQNFLNRYSHLAWSKYKVIEQLRNYHRVLYIDLDIVIRGDISELFNINGVAWRNGDSFHKKFGSRQKITDHAETKRIPVEHSSPNGGLFYISGVGNWEKYIEDGRNFLLKFMDFYDAGIDELVLAWIVFKNKLPLTSLDYKKYNTFPQLHNSDTRIIHFMGKDKPWNSELMQAIFPGWMKYYKETVKLVEFPDDLVIEFNNPGAFVKKKLNEQRWLSFLRESNFQIPKELRLNYVFENEWLIMHHSKSIYYELKFDQYSGGFLVGLWIKDRNLLEDKWVKQSLKDLNTRNSKVFKNLEDHRGLYIYSEKRSTENVPAMFDYFYNNTIKFIPTQS
ncbi:lipopolysaccharide biosynthesis protein [Avibacterium sp. 20-126]|uniref:glycosyltransferase n=1 Tax=Avibacterium sp. 20-126 TaxID=2911524 RepID=UPI00218C33C0|nr:lipopolysaccharide biosynthesis protein [Avibacterium sp. 20-126]